MDCSTPGVCVVTEHALAWEERLCWERVKGREPAFNAHGVSGSLHIHSLNKYVLSNSFLQGPEVLGQAEKQRHLVVPVPGFKAEISRDYQGLCLVPGERKRRRVDCHKST